MRDITPPTESPHCGQRYAMHRYSLPLSSRIFSATYHLNLVIITLKNVKENNFGAINTSIARHGVTSEFREDTWLGPRHGSRSKLLTPYFHTNPRPARPCIAEKTAAYHIIVSHAPLSLRKRRLSATD